MVHDEFSNSMFYSQRRTILTYFMPFGNGLGLAATGFMALAVYSVRIASDLLVQSFYMPKITWYFITSITFNLLSMFLFNVNPMLIICYFEINRKTIIMLRVCGVHGVGNNSNNSEMSG